ncbi:MAG: hypothetical protein AVDCRST_MAG91-1314, partial [uncultured Sphingomonadaceae bacterium]
DDRKSSGGRAPRRSRVVGRARPDRSGRLGPHESITFVGSHRWPGRCLSPPKCPIASRL